MDSSARIVGWVAVISILIIAAVSISSIIIVGNN